MPTNLINEVLVASDGTVWAATTTGLAWSRDKGRSWLYLRGRDYAAKVKGRYGGPPRGWKPAGKEVMEQLLPEDYVTCLVEDDYGQIWLGTRRAGYLAVDPSSNERMQGTKESIGLEDNYISAIVPMPDGRAFVGGYIGGLIRPRQAHRPPGSSRVRSMAAVGRSVGGTEGSPPPLPEPATAPTEEELQTLFRKVAALRRPVGNTYADYLGEDWTTWGDWVGRYGRQCAMLCAMNSPRNHRLGYDKSYNVTGQLGPHHPPDDSLRHWVHWVTTENPRSLYSPMIGIRRQASWDDHGEAFPREYEGPDLWVTVEIPEGIHRVSLYFFNKDGHKGNNRMRDYVLEVRTHHPDVAVAQRSSRLLARARVRDFWGGVYKQFLMRGPRKYFVKIAKNHSFNAICSGVFIDRLIGPPSWRDKKALPWMNGMKYRPPAAPKLSRLPGKERTKRAAELWRQARMAHERVGGAALNRRCRLAAHRAARADDAPPALLQMWRWRLCLWNRAQRERFARTMAEGWWRMQEGNPHLRTKEYRQYSPHTYDTAAQWERKHMNMYDK